MSLDQAEAHLRTHENPGSVEDPKQDGEDKLNKKSFSDFLKRGNLPYVSCMAVLLTKDVCLTYIGDKDTRYALLGCNDPKEAFQRVAIYLLDDGDGWLASLLCTVGHRLLAKVPKTMAGRTIQRIHIELQPRCEQQNKYSERGRGERLSQLVNRDKGVE